MKKILCSFVVTCCLVLVLASFAEVLAGPVADAGPDQVVFDEVTLDGSGSSDPDGTIFLYEWLLVHNENPAFNKIKLAFDPVVTVTDLSPGFYSVILTVTNDAQLKNSDVMSLAAAGMYVPTPRPSITAVDPDPSILETGDTVTLYGENFGVVQGEGSSVQIGKRALDILSWSDTVIEAAIPSYACRKFDGAPSTDVRIYVKVGDVESNKPLITINAPLDCSTP
jgi:hypothetical protein